MPFAMIPISGIVLICSIHIIRCNQIGVSTASKRLLGILKAAPFVFLLAIIALITLNHNIEIQLSLYLVTCLLITVLGCASLFCKTGQRPVPEKLSFIECLRFFSIDCFILLLFVVYSFISLDCLWNDLLFSVDIGFALIALFILMLVALFLYFLGQRSGILLSLAAIAITCVGIIQYFVVEYKMLL